MMRKVSFSLDECGLSLAVTPQPIGSAAACPEPAKATATRSDAVCPEQAGVAAPCSDDVSLAADARKACPEDAVVLFAGPCSVESEQQFNEVASCIADLGLSWIRGGAFKPRTNPYSFRGLGEEGLRIMAKARDSFGLKTISEVLDAKQCGLFDAYVDGFQVGARNFQNFSLLEEVGRVSAASGKPVLFKRGFAGTIAEWLSASEYLSMAGCQDIILCERGIRTFETATRFTLDIAAVPVVHRQSTLPICVDASHPAGASYLVPSLAKAALAAGCNAIMVEVHPHPASALSDGAQQLDLRQFEALVGELRTLAAALGKRII